MIRRPPRSTLFPYTDALPIYVLGGDRTLLDFFEVSIDAAGRANVAFASDAGSPGTASVGYTDRKSTRLNSSHDQISYAVFCLKKKKKIMHTLEYVFNTN